MIRLFEPGFFGKPSQPEVDTSDSTLRIGQLSPSDQVSLAEAFSWCKLQTLTATPYESPDILRRRALFLEAGNLYAEAYKRGEFYSDGSLYQKARALHTEADVDSLVMLRGQLRTADFLKEDEQGALSAETFSDAFSLVTSRRREHVKQLHIQVTSPSSKEDGRLLHYWPHENLACGAAEYSSNGFFDQNNVPPWDTWMSFDGRTLVSWVPSILIPLAQDGIDANPEGCIAWAT
jgi:hypothetical protein